MGEMRRRIGKGRACDVGGEKRAITLSYTHTLEDARDADEGGWLKRHEASSGGAQVKGGRTESSGGCGMCGAEGDLAYACACHLVVDPLEDARDADKEGGLKRRHVLQD
jgi:hypothetical protein